METGWSGSAIKSVTYNATGRFSRTAFTKRVREFDRRSGSGSRAKPRRWFGKPRRRRRLTAAGPPVSPACRRGGKGGFLVPAHGRGNHTRRSWHRNSGSNRGGKNEPRRAGPATEVRA